MLRPDRNSPSRFRGPLGLVAAAWAAVIAAAPAAADPFALRKIALEGDPAPDGIGTYSTVYSGVDVNAHGDVGIIVALNGDPSQQGVLVIRGDGSVDRVLTTDPPPPPLSGSYSYLGAPSLNAVGQFAFLAGIPFQNSWLLGSGDGLEVVASVGDPVPGLPGSTYRDNPDSIRIDDAGRVLLNAYLLNPAGNRTAVLRIDDAGVDVVAIKGDPAPTPTPSTFTVIHAGSVMNAAGTVAFHAITDLTGGVGTRGLFARRAGSLEAIALERQPAPVGTGRTFSFGSDPTPEIDAAGRTVFWAWVEPWEETANQGIFLHDGATIRALVLSGDPVPDAPGHTFLAFSRPQIGDGEIVGFQGAYDDQGDVVEGLYQLRNGQISTVIEDGDPLPGTGGAVLDGLSYWSVAMNPSGAFAFGATLSDGRRGVFLATPTSPAVPGLGPVSVAALGAILAGAGLAATRRRHA